VQRGPRHLDLIERPGDTLDVFCRWCRRVVFVIEAEEPHPVETLRFVDASHSVTCPGPRQN
jgi:hypothetical protein